MIDDLIFYQTKKFWIKKSCILKVINFFIFIDFLRIFGTFYIYFEFLYI